MSLSTSILHYCYYKDQIHTDPQIVSMSCITSERTLVLIYYSQPNMEPLTNLIVVHIPRNNAPPCLASIPLIDIDPEGIDKENYDDFEKKLGRIPDLKSHEGFRWAHRSLVSKCLGFGVGGTWEAVYMMYVCLDESAGLPRNEYLK